MTRTKALSKCSEQNAAETAIGPAVDLVQRQGPSCVNYPLRGCTPNQKTCELKRFLLRTRRRSQMIAHASVTTVMIAPHNPAVVLPHEPQDLHLFATLFVAPCWRMQGFSIPDQFKEPWIMMATLKGNSFLDLMCLALKAKRKFPFV